MEEKTIKLYPTNWLYNAGVIGFLKVITNSGEKDCVEKWLNEDGTVIVDRGIFKPIKVGNENLPKCIKKLTEYVVDDADMDKWIEKTDKQKRTYQDKYKDFFQKMGDFGYKFVQAGNKLFASNTPY